jgi:gluconolactonase
MPEIYRKVHPTFGRPHLGPRFDCYIEGATTDWDGNLYVVDIPYSRIFRIRPDGSWNLVLEYDGRPKGLALHPDGRIMVSDNVLGIMAFDPAVGSIQPLLSRGPFGNFRACNDITVSDAGDVIFSDQAASNLSEPNGAVYRWRAGGAVERLVADVPGPNGVVLTPDGSRLLVSATRANAIWCLELDDDGHHLKTGNFVQLSGGIGPDGLAFDEEGGLVVAHLGIGVWRFDVRGRPTHFIETPGGDMCSSVAFGGSDRRTLLITEASTGTIYAVAMPVPGRSVVRRTA